MVKESNLRSFKKLLIKNKLSKIFLITGKNSFIKSGAIKIIPDKIRKKIKFFYKKNSIPELRELKKIVLAIKKYKPDIMIAIGGGAVIDYAKVASVVDNLKDIKTLVVKNKIPDKKSCPLIAVPTTSGSGAEVTPNAVMYINKIKYTVDKKIIRPDKYFLIPKLTFSASKKVKASSGFDAIAQSIESLISVKSNKLSVAFAKKSLQLSLESYVNFVNRPNLLNGNKMSLAANISGRAIAISKTTAPHAISYPFTAHFGIPHGHAVALTLDKLLLFNFQNAKLAKVNFDLLSRYKLIFNLTKTKNIGELVEFIKQLKRLSGLEDNLKLLGINLKKEKNKILSGVNEQRLSNNPVKLESKDIIPIIS
jgi:alcohol dehydrogenase class IV